MLTDRRRRKIENDAPGLVVRRRRGLCAWPLRASPPSPPRGYQFHRTIADRIKARFPQVSQQSRRGYL